MGIYILYFGGIILRDLPASGEGFGFPLFGRQSLGTDGTPSTSPTTWSCR